MSSSQSTIIVWMDQKPMLINQDVPIFVDSAEVGKIAAKTPLKFEASPGHHKIYASIGGFVIDRVLEVDFQAGQASYFRAYVKCGMWVCSVYLATTEPSAFYDSVVHQFHDD